MSTGLLLNYYRVAKNFEKNFKEDIVFFLHTGKQMFVITVIVITEFDVIELFFSDIVWPVPKESFQLNVIL